MNRTLDITPAIAEALTRYEAACARFVPGQDSTDTVEAPLLELGAAVAVALGLPPLQQLFRDVVVPRPRPAKVVSLRRLKEVKAHAG